MKSILIAVLIFALPGVAQSQVRPEQRTRFDLPDTTKLSRDERTVMRIELSRSPAIARNDTTTLRRIYASDFRGMTAIGTQVDREQLLRVFSRDDGTATFLIDDIDVKRVGSTIVYSGRLSTFLPGGGLLGRSVFMHVYQMRDGRWQIIRAQGTQQRQPSTRAADSAKIRASIERGARGFMNANPDSILSHYARDIVLSYPGEPDMDRDALDKAYAGLKSRPANVTATTTPTFDEILVSGDLAIVRLRWTTKIKTAATASSPAAESTRYLKDLQVWRREPAGEWRFMRGMHYPDSTANK